MSKTVAEIPPFSGDSFPDAEVDAAAAAARDRIFAEIDRLALWDAVGELEGRGYVVLPPERVAPAGFAAHVLDALLDAAEADSGVRPDMATGATQANLVTRHGQVQHIEPLIHRHTIFQDALMNPHALALVTYLLGESCILFSSTGQLKGPGRHYLPLHADQANSGTPAPFPAMAQVCNAVWVLTDYDGANGSTCFVPGSHRLCRHPDVSEAVDLSLFRPIEARAGSIIVWHGNSWHGAVPRSNRGLRASIIQYFGRWYHNPGATFASRVSVGDIARQPPRFAQLIGANPTPGLDHRYASRATRFSQYA